MTFFILDFRFWILLFGFGVFTQKKGYQLEVGAQKLPRLLLFKNIGITGVFSGQAFTQLEEEDHGHGGAEATHALGEVITTIGHVSNSFFDLKL